MKLNESYLIPDWPAPANVRAIQTTRLGGYSAQPYNSLNLGTHVGDNALTVSRNRMLLNTLIPSEPVWLEQVHGTNVVIAEQANCLPKADACISKCKQAVCVVMTADCLPILLCDQAGSVVGAAHAGWKGLAAGIIETTVQTMQTDASQLMAWLGPAIGPHAFEVGDDVRDAFINQNAYASEAFTPHNNKWLADLYQLARLRLQTLGITQIYGGNFCTYQDTERFFSYRRDNVTGRMGSFIWIEK